VHAVGKMPERNVAERGFGQAFEVEAHKFGCEICGCRTALLKHAGKQAAIRQRTSAIEMRHFGFERGNIGSISPIAHAADQRVLRDALRGIISPQRAQFRMNDHPTYSLSVTAPGQLVEEGHQDHDRVV